MLRGAERSTDHNLLGVWLDQVMGKVAEGGQQRCVLQVAVALEWHTGVVMVVIFKNRDQHGC